MTARAPKSEMTMGCWLATDGGRKCPQCGKYAKSSELGFIGGRIPGGIITMYGHLPGCGCNKAAA